MTAPSVLTIVRNRTDHFVNLVEGLRRSTRQPGELIVIDMSDTPLERPDARFAINSIRLETDGLPLAQARNTAAGAASGENLVFLDVDCIPLNSCVAALEAALDDHGALICADIRYLKEGATKSMWDDVTLLRDGSAHPVRDFPAKGIRPEHNPGLFWSLAFAIRRSSFLSLGGFDERFTGYGAEDTDFGFRAAAAGIPLLFCGDAKACHQHHATYDPPLQHFDDIMRNAVQFHRIWNRWPMEGWLAAFETRGLIVRGDGGVQVLRSPTEAEMAAARTG